MPIGLRRWSAVRIRGQPQLDVLPFAIRVFVGVAKSRLVPLVDLVIDLEVDLPPIKLVRALKGLTSQITITTSSTHPGKTGRIQTVANIPTIRVGHKTLTHQPLDVPRRIEIS